MNIVLKNDSFSNSSSNWQRQYADKQSTVEVAINLQGYKYCVAAFLMVSSESILLIS